MSIESQILHKIKEQGNGAVFFVEDFIAFGSSKACGKALERLTLQGTIVRVARGIYSYPKISELLGPITPSVESIAEAIARRDKARIVPTGEYAMNILGLSTQIPMKVIYLTDGMPRKIMLGNRTLILKKAAPKNLVAKGKISGLVIQALKFIGKDNLTEITEHKVIDLLKQESQENLIHDMSLAPEWIRILMRRIQYYNELE